MHLLFLLYSMLCNSIWPMSISVLSFQHQWLLAILKENSTSLQRKLLSWLGTEWNKSKDSIIIQNIQIANVCSGQDLISRLIVETLYYRQNSSTSIANVTFKRLRMVKQQPISQMIDRWPDCQPLFLTNLTASRQDQTSRHSFNDGRQKQRH